MVDNWGPGHRGIHLDQPMQLNDFDMNCHDFYLKICLDPLDILTQVLLAGISVEFKFAEVVGVLLPSPGSSQPLVHVQLLQLLRLHIFPHP